MQERKQVEELVAKIADEDAKEAKARSEKQVECLGSAGSAGWLVFVPNRAG